MPAVELNLQRLQRDAKVNDDLLTLLKTRHQEALIKESEGVEEVTLVRPATEPAAPLGSEAFNTVLVGALLGLMLGGVLAFVQETLDTSIGTIEDVESRSARTSSSRGSAATRTANPNWVNDSATASERQ